jgi:DNA-binding beta-propeller fold protein YncE
MQFGPTSLTPWGATIIGPSVWLLDVPKGRAKQIIGTAATAADPGIFLSASDLVVAGHKLYVAEEDSINGTFGEDGSVSVFDISNIKKPIFLKRLRPGDGLPGDFVVAHGLNVTPDERFVYVASYASSYILKIDTDTDEVVKEFGPNRLNAPHGAFIAGAYR